MKLQDQVIGLNQAMRLKGLGVKQKSLFYHHPAFDTPVFGETVTTEHGKKYKKIQVCNDKKGSASAITELTWRGHDVKPNYESQTS